MRLHRLDLNLLVVLERLLTEKSVRKTSEQLHMSQPAVSGALKRLRAHFGDELLTMRGSAMQPTDFALQLLTPVQETLSRLRAIAVASPSFDPYVSDRRFSIVLSEGLGPLFSNEIARRFAEGGYSVSLRLVSNSAANFERFERGGADLLLLREGFDFPSLPLFTETFSVIAWVGNPLVSDAITAEQFCDFSHVLVAIGEWQSTPSIADEHLQQLGVRRRSKVTVASYGLAPTGVLGTNLVATIPTRLASLMATWLPLKVLPLPFPIAEFVQNVYWHPFSDHDLAVQWLVREFVDVARTLAPDCYPPSADTISL